MGGTGGATGGTGGGTGGSGGDECTFSMDQGGDCDICWHAACANECTATMKEPSLNDYMDCYYGCSDATCTDQCDAQYPTVAAAFTAMSDCIGGNCATECATTECAPGCPDYWLGDNYCDSACNVEACNYDDGDCGTTTECAPGCPDYWLGDSYCDTECNVAACNYDNGDCGTTTECAPGCPDYWLGDSYCDSACNVAACNFDNGDCGGSTCSLTMNRGADCDNCWHTACATECDSAMADPYLNDLLTCYSSCYDLACSDACDAQYPATAATLVSINTCINGNCATECEPDPCTLTLDQGGPCDACWHASCATECGSALAEPTLNELLICYNGCSNQTCSDACDAQYPAAVAALTPLMTCIETTCVSECQ